MDLSQPAPNPTHLSIKPSIHTTNLTASTQTHLNSQTIIRCPSIPPRTSDAGIPIPSPVSSIEQAQTPPLSYEPCLLCSVPASILCHHEAQPHALSLRRRVAVQSPKLLHKQSRPPIHTAGFPIVLPLLLIDATVKPNQTADLHCHVNAAAPSASLCAENRREEKDHGVE
jgi:hypothetical protein